MIGQIDRIAIFVRVLTGHPTGVGFLIAAKSILRFVTTTQQRAGKYVIIAKLASLTRALATGVGTLARIDVLPATSPQTVRSQGGQAPQTRSVDASPRFADAIAGLMASMS